MITRLLGGKRNPGEGNGQEEARQDSKAHSEKIQIDEEKGVQAGQIA
jgi:hypothetical protein